MTDDEMRALYAAEARRLPRLEVLKRLEWFRQELGAHIRRGLSQRGGQWIPWERALRAKIAAFEEVADG